MWFELDANFFLDFCGFLGIRFYSDFLEERLKSKEFGRIFEVRLYNAVVSFGLVVDFRFFFICFWWV